MRASSPLPVSAETGTNATPLICGRRRSQVSLSSASLACGPRTKSHLFTAMTSARPSSTMRSAICKSCFSKSRSASSTSTTTSANLMALSASPTASSSALPSTRIFRLSPAVSNGLGTVALRTGNLLDGLAEFADADPVLRGDRQRRAEPKRVSFVHTGLRGAALAFVGGEDHRLAGCTHQLGEDLVASHDTRPRIDQEHDEVSLLDGGHGLIA